LNAALAAFDTADSTLREVNVSTGRVRRLTASPGRRWSQAHSLAFSVDAGFAVAYLPVSELDSAESGGLHDAVALAIWQIMDARAAQAGAGHSGRGSSSSESDSESDSECKSIVSGSRTPSRIQVDGSNTRAARYSAANHPASSSAPVAVFNITKPQSKQISRVIVLSGSRLIVHTEGTSLVGTQVPARLQSPESLRKGLGKRRVLHSLDLDQPEGDGITNVRVEGLQVRCTATGSST
jgi:hypothetical protein